MTKKRVYENGSIYDVASTGRITKCSWNAEFERAITNTSKAYNEMDAASRAAYQQYFGVQQ